MNKFLFTIGLIFQFFLSFGQQISPRFLEKPWDAYWINSVDYKMGQPTVVCFRKEVNIADKPANLWIHVSGDQRYHFYVNGIEVCYGPAKGDMRHWYFETVDIAPYLTKGKNTLAAKLWHLADKSPLAIPTYKMGFILQADSLLYNFVNTDSSWRCMIDESYRFNNTNYIKGYFVSGNGETVLAKNQLTGWEKSDFDMKSWKKPVNSGKGNPGTFTWSSGHWLTPRIIPTMESRWEDTPKMVESTNLSGFSHEDFGRKDLVIPPQSEIKFLLHQGYETIGYPQLEYSFGDDAYVSFNYCESLLDTTGKKANRSAFKGLKVAGLRDTLYTSGKPNSVYSPYWIRCFQFVEITVKTKNDKLIIHNFKNKFTAYPFQRKAIFETGNDTLSRINNVGWQTARLCAGETYFDCPFWEQLQYVGDTRIQALISLYQTGDDRLMRQAIEQINYSRLPEGLTCSRYPCKLDQTQVIPPFSLFWVSMVYDYFMHSPDKDFVKKQLPGIQSVLAWFQSNIQSNLLLGKLQYWNFMDWVPSWKGGIAKPRQYSSLQTLHYVYTLYQTAFLFEQLGRKTEADIYKNQADEIKKAVFQTCFDAKRKLFAESPDKTDFSQHTNIMAILTDAIPQSEQKALLNNLLTDTTLYKASIYFKFYLFRAMLKVGEGNKYLDNLFEWKFMLNMGATTFWEEINKTRSDCHAWSASPCYDFFSLVAGIEPNSPGFKTVKIAPNPGRLKKIKATCAHPKGLIEMDFLKTDNNSVKAEVILPIETSGIFVWEGKTYILNAGKNTINTK